MAYRIRSIIGAAALVGATTVITSQVVSQQQEQEMAEMWAKWMELAQPGKEHAEMAKLAGAWNQESTHWMHPGAEPTTSTSVAKFEPILGGRYMIEHVTGQNEFMGEVHDFEGIAILGFDNLKQKHVFAWIDNMGTMIMTGEGDADETGKVITYYSEMPNPMGGGTMQIKSVSKIISDDETVYSMHEKQPDGSWFKNFQIVSTRKN
jgi:hypothetical protein